MGVSQRFQNLIFHNRFTAAKSLHCIDLTRQLFGNTATPPPTIGDVSVSAVVEVSTSQTPVADSCCQKNEQAAAAALEMERIQLPCPIFTFQAAPNESCKIDCFPFADRKMLWADHLGRPFLFDAEMHQMDIMPCLHKPKIMPISLFVSNVDADNDYVHLRPGSSLFVMERYPRPDLSWSAQWDGQFEALVYCKPTVTSFTKSWQWQLIQPPPDVHQLKYCNSYSHPEISSYAVLSIGGETHICISVKGVGTYCLDTANRSWRKVGNWTLPFHGRVEYVPEFKLWFGFTTEARQLAAADLSTMDCQPQLVSYCKEICLPEEWKECKDSQLVNLGSGRFCILRFLEARTPNGESRGDIDQNVAVFTGVEVVPRLQDANGNSGKVELGMIPRKSLCHKSNGTTIDAVF